MLKNKVFAIVLMCSITTGLLGCQSSGQKSGTVETKNGTQEAVGTEGQQEEGKNTEGDNSSENGSGLLQLNRGNPYCYTEEGYYYVTGYGGDNDVLKDGTPCQHIMYMDYATKQEVYLCSNAGCNHDTEDCTAVLSGDEDLITSGEFLPFLYGEKLYILCKPYDSSGAVSSEWVNPEYEDMIVSGGTDGGQSILYRMNPDGTDRETVYTFDEELTIGSLVFAENNHFYFETCKIDMQQMGENSTYYAAADRKVTCLDLNTGKLSDVYAFDDQGAKWGTWELTGNTGSELILMRTIYPSDFTEDDWMFEKDEIDAYMEKYKRSTDEYAFLNLSSGTLTTKYQMSNEVYHYNTLKDGSLYLTFEDDNRLVKVDLESGKETTLLQDDKLKDGAIWDVYEDYLTVWTDDGLYLINYKNGEICDTPLVDSLGWNLTIRAENSDSFLVIYDYDASPDELNEGGYNISQYKFALIDKKDLFSGKKNYQPIQMVGKGE